MKGNYISKRIITLLLIALLASSFSSIAIANTNNAQQPLVISQITSGNVKFELVNLNIIPNGSSSTVSFSVTVNNNQNTTLSMDDYWVRVKSKSGDRFTVSLNPADRDVNKIAPKTKRTISFNSTVNASTKLSDLEIQMIYWDFSMPNYEKILGDFKLPANYSNIVPVKGFKQYYNSENLIKAQVTNASLGKTDNNHAVSVEFELQNIGSTHSVLPGYKFYIQTKNNLLYPLETADLDGQESLYPFITKKIDLKGTIPGSIDSKGWQLILAESDESSRIILPIAAFYLPDFKAVTETPSEIVEPGKYKDISINDMLIRSKVESFSRGTNDKDYINTINFSFENISQSPINVPNYTFAIRTSDGLTYPMNSGLSNITINPRVIKDIKLSVNIPKTVNENNWSLIVLNPVADGSDPMSGKIIATYKLPERTSGLQTIGTDFDYSNADGQYIFRLDHIQRLPWEDQDILSAKITVKNPSSSSKPLPKLSGYFMLDNSVKVPFKAIQNDNVIAIKNNFSATFSLYGLIPYTYDYSNLRIILEDNIEDTAQAIVEYTTDDTTKGITQIALNQTHKITGVGRQSDVSIRSVSTYESGDGQLFTVLVDVKNLEKRFSDIINFVGHFKTSDDLIFPANITDIKPKITPMGVATLYITSYLPSNINTNEIQLILGEGVKDNQLIIGGDAEAYVNPVSFALPNESKEPKSNFENLTIFPYTISLTNFSAKVQTITSFSFSFNYALSKNQFVETSDEDHQIVLEFTDLRGGIAFSKSFTINKGDSTSNLKLGSHNLSYIEEDEAILYKLQNLQKYKLKIYDEFMGQKKLLAEKEFQWSITTN